MTPNADRVPKRPDIKMPLPGPKAQAIIARDERVISPSYTRGYPLVMSRGVGAMVEDVDGNWFLDFCSGIAVCASGHGHPKVVEAVTAQAERFLHMSGTDFYYECMVDLAERLDRLSAGESPKRVFFCNSGAEAIEGAMKLARYATGRQGIISFYRGFHGRTYGAMSVSASKSLQKASFGPFVPGVYHAHYPYPYRPFFGNADPIAEAEACLAFLRDYVFKMIVPPGDVAAILLESVQGEGGYVVPPPNWLPGLRELCDAHGILLITDEIQSGVGRTGKMWACEHDGVEPDILTSAKGLASGLPLGAIIAKADLMTWRPGMHATTFGGNPVACQAALATLDLVENGLMQNAAAQGERLMAGLRQLQTRFPAIGDVRGRGLMVGFEIVSDADSRAKDAAKRDAMVDACFEEGLLILGCGENNIRLCPPLTIDADDVDTALSIIEKVLTQS